MSSEEKAAQLFGQILGQVLNKSAASSGGSTASGAPASEAVIVAPAAIPNAFSLETEFSSWKGEGRLLIGIYQGRYAGALTPGYRLAYTPGGAFEVQRVSSRGVRTVETAAAPYPLEDKKIHRIVWSRNGEGRIKLRVDDADIMDTADRGFRDAFDTVALVNTGGDYIIKRVTVQGGR